MRRMLLIFLMCLLPFQWSWAAAASACEHESHQASHFGHHEHEHRDAGQANHEADGESPADLADSHPDCATCHGLGGAFVGADESLAPALPPGGPLPPYAAHCPDAPVSFLLRPPLTFVA